MSIEFIVPEGVTPQRADKVLARFFIDVSRVQLQELFNEGQVFLEKNPIKKSHLVQEGDRLLFSLPPPKEIPLPPIDIPLSLLYEDEEFIVINKAANQVVHPGTGTGNNTLVHALLHHCQGNLSSMGGPLRPGVVHRLDKDTTGVIVFAKSNRAYLQLIKQFKQRTVEKEYVALVKGVPSLHSGTIKEPIARHVTARTKMQVLATGSPAHTEWVIEKLCPTKPYAFLRCYLHTGRTHQLRVHLSYIGHPIIGDTTYGDHSSAKLASRVLLHAHRLAFVHPSTKEKVHFEAPYPPDLQSFLE